MFGAERSAQSERGVIDGTVLGGTPAEFGKIISDATEKWARVIKVAGMAKPSRRWRCRRYERKFDELGLEPVGNMPAEFAAVIRKEMPEWAKVIKDAGIKLGN